MIAARAVGIKVDMVAVAVATTIVGSGQFPPPVDRRVRGQLSKDIHHHGGYQGRSHCLGFSVNVLTDDAPAVFLQGGPRPHRSHPEAGADLAASWETPSPLSSHWRRRQPSPGRTLALTRRWWTPCLPFLGPLATVPHRVVDARRPSGPTPQIAVAAPTILTPPPCLHQLVWPGTRPRSRQPNRG